MYTVGQKGQVVIARELREKLGIQPGWLTIQRVVGNQLHMEFVPPEHERSLLGMLSGYSKTGDESTAWQEGAAEEWQD